jgi:hypothetical protein
MANHLLVPWNLAQGAVPVSRTQIMLHLLVYCDPIYMGAKNLVARIEGGT